MAIPPFRFRKASISDLDQLVMLFDAYRVFYGKDSDTEPARNFLRERLETGDTVIIVAAEKNSQLCGFTQLFPVFTSVGMKRLWLLNDLYVHENYRGQGIGEQLIEKAKEHARQTGARGLFLQTAAANITAQRLYDRCGFVKDDAYYWYEWNA